MDITSSDSVGRECCCNKARESCKKKYFDAGLANECLGDGSESSSMDSSQLYCKRAYMQWWYQKAAIMNEVYWATYFGMYRKAFQHWSTATHNRLNTDNRFVNKNRNLHHQHNCRFKNVNQQNGQFLKRIRPHGKGPNIETGNKMPKTDSGEVNDNFLETDSSDELDSTQISDQNNDENFEIELNDEFKRFLEISEKHRQARDKEKQEKRQKNKGKHKNDYNLDFIDVCDQPIIASTAAPKSTSKQEIYEETYGTGYVEILSLEADVQLNFDKFCDSFKPSYWPNIPLKL